MKLFASIVQLLIQKQTDDTARMLSTIRTQCIPGCGRQALRVLDGDFMHQGPKRRQVALVALHNMKAVNELSQVEPCIIQLRGILMELRGSPEMPSDAFVLGMLRSLFGGISKLSPIFLTFDLLPNMQPQYLLDTIMKTCVEYRSNQNLKAPKVPPKANANGAVDGKGGGKGKGGKGGKSDKSEKCKKCGKSVVILWNGA